MSDFLKVEADFKEVVKLLNDSFGVGYANKNPLLVQFLMERIQQEKDRAITLAINNLNPTLGLDGQTTK